MQLFQVDLKDYAENAEERKCAGIKVIAVLDNSILLKHITDQDYYEVPMIEMTPAKGGIHEHIVKLVSGLLNIAADIDAEKILNLGQAFYRRNDIMESGLVINELYNYFLIELDGPDRPEAGDIISDDCQFVSYNDILKQNKGEKAGLPEIAYAEAAVIKTACDKVMELNGERSDISDGGRCRGDFYDGPGMTITDYRGY